MERDPAICVYCANRTKEACAPCGEEGKFRHLEADTLSDWEQPPELPPMRDLVEMPAAKRLAVVWLNARFAEKARDKGNAV